MVLSPTMEIALNGDSDTAVVVVVMGVIDTSVD